MTTLLETEIIDTEVEAEYQGNVYERTVVIKLDGSEITVFDGANIITDSDRGSAIGLELRAQLVQDLETVTEPDPDIGIEQKPNRESKWSATVTGRIISEDVDVSPSQTDPTVILDIGSGTIQLNIDNPDITKRRVGKGDVIRAICGRIDIIGRGN